MIGDEGTGDRVASWPAHRLSALCGLIPAQSSPAIGPLSCPVRKWKQANSGGWKPETIIRPLPNFPDSTDIRVRRQIGEMTALGTWAVWHDGSGLTPISTPTPVAQDQLGRYGRVENSRRVGTWR